MSTQQSEQSRKLDKEILETLKWIGCSIDFEKSNQQCAERIEYWIKDKALLDAPSFIVVGKSWSSYAKVQPMIYLQHLTPNVYFGKQIKRPQCSDWEKVKEWIKDATENGKSIKEIADIMNTKDVEKCTNKFVANKDVGVKYTTNGRSKSEEIGDFKYCVWEYY
ncbi:hypothetical protein FGO68_gene5898 [Halteria grandinella]|uniref:Uncharacterized protein n=1 Tax=Halteria grandinella TaxID=5974 RepID=A0A8J8NI45_HALGN|nr:hypothetical protein FGO68_gene5898 [Halteria grandinella]